VRCEPVAELGPPRPPEQRAAREPQADEDDEGAPRPPRRIPDQRRRDVLDRGLGAGEELQVALEVAAERLERGRRVDGGDAARDLLHRDPHAQREGKRGIGDERAERTEVDGQ